MTIPIVEWHNNLCYFNSLLILIYSIGEDVQLYFRDTCVCTYIKNVCLSCRMLAIMTCMGDSVKSIPIDTRCPPESPYTIRQIIKSIIDELPGITYGQTADSCDVFSILLNQIEDQYHAHLKKRLPFVTDSLVNMSRASTEEDARPFFPNEQLQSQSVSILKTQSEFLEFMSKHSDSWDVFFNISRHNELTIDKYIETYYNNPERKRQLSRYIKVKKSQSRLKKEQLDEKLNNKLQWKDDSETQLPVIVLTTVPPIVPSIELCTFLERSLDILKEKTDVFEVFTLKKKYEMHRHFVHKRQMIHPNVKHILIQVHQHILPKTTIVLNANNLVVNINKSKYVISTIVCFQPGHYNTICCYYDDDVSKSQLVTLDSSRMRKVVSHCTKSVVFHHQKRCPQFILLKAI